MENQNFSIKYQLSENSSFQNFQEYAIAADSFKTELSLGSLTPNKRYWFRYKLDESNSEFSEVKSFYTSGNRDFILIDSTSFNEQSNNALQFQNDKILISPKLDNISAVSYTHLRAHETVLDLVCRLLLEKKKNTTSLTIKQYM